MFIMHCSQHSGFLLPGLVIDTDDKSMYTGNNYVIINKKYYITSYIPYKSVSGVQSPL